MMTDPNQLFSFFKSDFSCMQAKFNPLDPKKIAIPQSDNFGIVGKGRLTICEFMPQIQMKIITNIPENDAIFDCSWHEENPNLLVYSCGTGEVKMIDIITQKILFQQMIHKGEVQSVECSHKQPNLILTAGMDGTTRVVDLIAAKQIFQFQSHQGCNYQSTWHPVNQAIFASAGADGALRLWDINAKNNKNIASIKAHQGEVLSCDFNKYEEQIATCSTDKGINLWDLRNLKMPLNQFVGHRYPVKKIKFSPHESNIMASASYDMSVIIWDTSSPMTAPTLQIHQAHTEFVVSVDFNLEIPKQISSASWDGKTYVWQWDQKQPQIP